MILEFVRNLLGRDVPHVVSEADPLPVTLSGVSNAVTITGPLTVSNEVEIKNDSGNPVLVSPVVSKGSGAVNADTQRVTLATDGPGVAALEAIAAKTPALVGALSPVEPLGAPTVARQPAAGTASASTALSAGCRRISIRARFADIRYAIGTGAQTANATNSHFIGVDERLDLAVPANAQIAVIRDSAATVNGSLELTELA